ncbi:stage II sporulation protein GA (Sporulation sigma-E factor processing peptidase) [Eubacterium sp. CAG:248]|nr:stage II sporulation protein GA (Sporulation sigma-E factor processing peptidase) [Eubacterium sp. CAG:248]
MDLIILLIVNRIMRYHASAIRLLLSSTLGAVWSVAAVMIPDRYRLFVNLCTYFIVTALMLAVINSPLNIIKARQSNNDRYALTNYLKELFKGMIIMLSVACFSGGIMHMIVYYTYAGWIIRRILVTYNQLIYLILISVVVIIVIARVYRTYKKNSDIYKVTVIVDNHKIMLHGIVDTGNQLTDKYTGKPVNVMDKSYFENVLYQINDYGRLKYHFIPYRTIGNNEGIIEVITSDYMYISGKDETKAYKGALIGLSDRKVSQNGEYQALINGRMI